MTLKKSVGRPLKKESERAQAITISLPKRDVAVLRRRAKRSGQSVSALIQEALKPSLVRWRKG